MMNLNLKIYNSEHFIEISNDPFPLKFLSQLINSFPNSFRTISYIYIYILFIHPFRNTRNCLEKERKREQISAMQKDLYYHPDRKTRSFELPPSSLRLKSILPSLFFHTEANKVWRETYSLCIS